MFTHLFGGVLRAAVGVTVSTLTQDVELAVDQATIQLFTVLGGEPVSVKLPPVGVAHDHYLILRNDSPSGAPDLLVKNALGVVIDQLQPDHGGIYACNGVGWHVILRG